MKQAKARPKKEITIVEDPNNVSSTTVEAKSTASSLINAVKSERRESANFLKYLENVLQQGELDQDQSFQDENSFRDYVFARDNSFSTGNLSMTENRRRQSFDATGYFYQSQNDFSHIFDQTKDRSLRDVPDRRKSDIGLSELSTLPRRAGKETLSEVFHNHPAVTYSHDPTLEEDVKNLQDSLKSNRRESEMFEKRLRHLLDNP